uniref:OTU domain-containing protein n=1 Tax=Lutzomyia longipalpis TaxID=7200 RepID=A0A905HKW2_LUTLO
MNQLILSPQTLGNFRRKKIEGLTPIRLRSDDAVICIREGRQLIGYKYVPSAGTWRQYWNEVAFDQEGNYPLDQYPWLVADNVIPNENTLLLRHPNGMQIYQLDQAKPGLKLLNEDIKFNEFFSGDLLLGHFYPDAKYAGIMTRDVKKEIKFYATTMIPKKPPISALKINIPSSTWKAAETEFFVTKLTNKDSEVIGLRTNEGLEFYQFNSDYVLQQVAKTSLMPRTAQSAEDHLFFANLTNNIYQDILYLNGSGLFLYQYNNGQKDYKFLNFNNEFTEPYGWLPQYGNSIRLTDLNGDNLDDLLFTGPQGITALSFDTTNNNWKSLLNSEELSGAQRYANIVGTLPPIPPTLSHPTIFIQDSEGNVQWAKVLPAPIPTTTIAPRTTPRTTTNRSPIVSTNTSPSPNYHPKPSVPEQIPCANLPDKPTLRLAEQWDDSFLKQVVDPASGQVQMYLPLIDIFPVTGWRLQLGLSYNSQSSNSDLLGIGWALPLAQDYITIDYQGSIYPEDAHYYLVTQGRPQKLKLIENKNGVQNFKLEELEDTDEEVEITIQYNPSKQSWIIEGTAEQSTYGKASHNAAQDALQWRLGWPNWHGIGREKSTLQPIISSWYLNMRLDKNDQKTLYYHYEKDTTTIDGGKSYDAALRLKTINDGQGMRILFDYAPKRCTEHSQHKPVDKDGNIIFPVPLDQSHYLQGYSITTTSYSQAIKFSYQVNDDKRLLTSIQQQILSHTEPILKFRYQTLLDKYVLHTCTYLPKGSSVQLNYQSLAQPELSIVNRYPIRERAKVAYGSDYVVISYQDFNERAGKIILRIMNREMTETFIDCSVSADLACPSAESEIKDYDIKTYQNSFIVLTESTKKRSIHIFNRHGKKWSGERKIYGFGKKALIQFSETLIAAAEPNEKKLMLFRREPTKQSDWKKQTFTLSKPVTALALHNRLIVSYDDNQLFLFYYDDKLGWKYQYLDSKASDISAVFDLFDLDLEMKEQIVTALKKNSLQIINNFILLNTLQENGGQLSTLSHLFLLDSQYKIAKKQSFRIDRERINDLTYEHKDDGSVYKISYVKENGRFRLKLKVFPEKLFNIIDYYKISNENIQEDFRDGSDSRVQEHIKQLNQSEGWKKALNKSLLFDSNLYMAQIGQQGVYVGSDTILRITGTKWEKDSLPSDQTTPLGKHFVIETGGDDKSLVKLYKQNSNGQKQGGPIQELKLHAPGQLINEYPAYIAYHQTPTLVKVLTFKDEQTLGKLYAFDGEQLLPGNDMQNLVTVANASSTTMIHAESQECRVRAVSTLLSPKVQPYVNQMILSANEIKRVTAYEHSFSTNQRTSTYSEKVTIIPGGAKDIYGWHEAIRSYHRGNVTTTEHWFNADGGEVLGPPEEESKEEDPIKPSTSKPNPMVLMDRSRKWVISDFSPYSLEDEMVAYFGFEPYENNQIGTPTAGSKTKSWRTVKGKIIKRNFPFTGQHFLQLDRKSTNQPSFFEGIFQPNDQETTYLAACWIRTRTPIILNTAVPYLKAVIHTTSGQKIITLKAQSKYQLGDWTYLELPLDFQVLKQIYRDYINYSTSTPENNVSFKITLRVEAPAGETVDLDHIRFAPITHDFKAAVYHPIIGKPTAIIQANGLVTRTIYNHLQREIASTDEEGKLQEFSSSSRTGKLVPAPQGSRINSKPNVLTFEPEYGSYETFDANSWRSRWKLNNPNAWLIASGKLWHKQPEKHHIEARANLFHGSSAAIRFYFNLQEARSSLSLHWPETGSIKLTRQSDNFTRLTLPNNHAISALPSAGEIIVMLEQNYLWIWVDAVLIVDQSLAIDRSLSSALTPWSSFMLEAQGNVLVEDCLIMNRPQVTVKYFNEFGEKTQIIQLEDVTTVQVKEMLYDALGREGITTKTTRIKRKAGQPLLSYRLDFVSNANPQNSQSVWQKGMLQGEVNQLNPSDQGFAYKRTEYAPNPLNQEKILGLPGPEYSITGRCASKISEHSDIAFLNNLFPSDEGYRQKAEHTANDSLRINVFDKNNNEVAKYVRVQSFNHLLSTYEYDTENRLIKILPPLYHEKVDSARRTKPWRAGDDHLSANEKQWQDALATRFIYDKYGHLIRKITPDSGTTEYLYNSAGQMRFMISTNTANQSQKIIYYTYDENDQLISTGHINGSMSLTTLNQHLDSAFVPYAENYQKFDYADDHFDPLLRGRVQQYITQNDGEVIVEKLHFDAQQQVLSKKTILNRLEPDPFANIEKQYVNDKLHNLIYPINVDNQPLNLVHSYNRLGQLVGLGTLSDPTHYASFTYHATGQLASEQYQPNTRGTFTRNYNYNSPGFLEQISDPFLTESIAYTEKGYGQVGFGDGMVMQTTFNASWPVNADGRWFEVQENALGGNFSALCIKALKRTGYLTDSGQPIKLYNRDAEQTLPLKCGGETARLMAKLVAQKKKPIYYGHRYAYGNHQELVKAKYFTDDTENLSNPLQPDSFSKEISGLTKEHSQHIWDLLSDAGYIITDQQREDKMTAVGKRGDPIFRNNELYDDLQALNDKYTLYDEPIERLIISAISQQKPLAKDDFVATFLHWQELDQSSSKLIYNWQLEIANQIGDMLLTKGYLPTNRNSFTRPLNPKFTSILHNYAAFIPSIVKTLSKHFNYELGKTAFDVQTYDIDANGNHRLFYTGFDRFELAYRTATNQIEKVLKGWTPELNTDNVFPMKHDGDGNVVQALHKNIKQIDYHPVSQRTTRIKLTDDRTLRFYYDAHGERVLKRVFNPDGSVSHETHYLRDEKGRVLMDRQTKYLNGSTQKIVTAYLYGPRGLLGFIRNNNFYSVTTDHSGSVRLVIKDGKVVAAYDYLPYGGLMRSFGNDPQAHIVYRYTGQEWDEETDLYNYHARLYDPSIGRFYQIDPKAQYFSPYIYAGNSPISVVDPDGEFAFLLTCLVLGLIGAYLGGAAANNRWNPVDWDYKDPNTWIGIVGGGIAGGLAPLGAVASVQAIGALVGGSLIAGTVGTIGLGLGGAYLTTAASQGWDPSKWKWDRPGTWSSLFQGFSSGAGIAGGIGVTHSFANGGKAIMYLGNLKALNTIGISQRAVKGIFLAVSYTTAGSVAYIRAGAVNGGNFAFWEWDWTNAATWAGLVDGFDTGMGWPQNIMEMGRGAATLLKNPKRFLFSGQNDLKLTSILKDPKHPLYKATTSVVMAFYMGSAANGDFDITNWNLGDFSTYEGVLNGVFFGKDITKTLKYIRDSKIKQPSNALVPTTKTKGNSWSRNVNNMLDFIQVSRIGGKYQHLVEQAFTISALWLAKLGDQSSSIRKQAENFFKGGVKKWKSGQERPPRELQRLILAEAIRRVQDDGEMTNWKAESEEVLRRKQEVFPEEEDMAFLNCKGGKRMKRSTQGSGGSCSPMSLDLNNNELAQHTKRELIQQFFDSTDYGLPQRSGYINIESSLPKSVNVPGDGNCLFWATALGYLTPVKDNPEVFQQRFIKLFDTNENIDAVYKWIQAYNPFGEMNTNPILQDLVTNKLRNKVVDYMMNHRGDYEPYIAGEFNAYMDSMKRPNTWGGEHEISAMSEMLDASIKVHSDSVSKYGDSSNVIELFHEPLIEGGGTKNHYNFGILMDTTDILHGQTYYFDPGQPVGFAQHLSLILSKTPNVLAPTKSVFYPNLILGSILTLPSNVKKKTVYAKLEDVDVAMHNSGGEYGNIRPNAQILKIYFKDGNNIILKTFVFEPKSYKTIVDGKEKIEQIPSGAYENIKKQLDLKSRYSEAELNAILANPEFRKSDVNKVHIKENIYYISRDRQLSVSERDSANRMVYRTRVLDEFEDFTQELSNKRSGTSRKGTNQLKSYLISLGLDEMAKNANEAESRLSDADLRALRDKMTNTLSKRDFKLIEPAIDRIDLEDVGELLNKISSDKIADVEAGIKEFSEELLKIYNDNAKTFGFDLDSESGFHGFFYGALSLNFKYRYNLDIYVERIAGRGYSDLILLSRDGPEGTKNWRAIPIVVELKADTTSADHATDQTTGTGYLYNLSMRTVAQKAIVLGINSKLGLPANPTAENINSAIKKAITIKQEDIPQSEGFIRKLKDDINGNINYRDVENNIAEEFKHIYYSISPLAIKTKDKYNDQYLSRMILGEITSEKGRDVYVQSDNDLSTFVFKEGNKWVMINLIESSEKVNDKTYKFKNVNIDGKVKLPVLTDGQITNFIRIDVAINSKSKHGWSPSAQKRATFHNSNTNDFYFQGISVKDGDVNLQRTEFKKLNSLDTDKFFSSPKVMMDDLSANLIAIKDTINSESDFQAVLQGLFYGLAKKVERERKGMILRVFPEANLSKEGRSDLIISVLEDVPGQQIREESITVMELKYSHGQGTNDLKDANEQVKKYATNLKSVTDLYTFTPIAAVFCKNCQGGTIKFQVHKPQTIHHTSARMGPIGVNMNKISSFKLEESQFLEEINSQAQFLSLEHKRTGSDISDRSDGNPADMKKPKMEDRKKRSIEKDFLSPNPASYEEANNLDTVSSGSSKLHFWPVNLVKKTGAAFASILGAFWLPLDSTYQEDNKPYPQLESFNEPQKPHESSSTGPTLLDLGDQWLNSNNVDGLLTWGTLLARKITGYRPKTTETSSFDPAIGIQLSIRSHELVNIFMERVLEHAEAFGVDVSVILENTKLYTKSIETVCRKLGKEELDIIIDYLFDQIVQKNIKKVL